jgi:hypothetical protein
MSMKEGTRLVLGGCCLSFNQIERIKQGESIQHVIEVEDINEEEEEEPSLRVPVPLSLPLPPSSVAAFFGCSAATTALLSEAFRSAGVLALPLRTSSRTPSTTRRAARGPKSDAWIGRVCVGGDGGRERGQRTREMISPFCL